MTSRRQPMAKAKPLPPAPSSSPNRNLPTLPRSQQITASPAGRSTNLRSNHQPVYSSSQKRQNPPTSMRVASSSPNYAAGTTTTSTSYFKPNTSTQAPSSYAPRTRYIGTAGDKISIVRSWAVNQDVLDVYMVNAFYTGTNQRMQYPLALWKTATCFGLQTVGVVLLMSNTYKDLQDGSQSGQCVARFNSLSWIAFLFTLYISLFCVQSIKSLNQYGMLSDGWVHL